LQHPNIVQIHDVGTHEGRPYFSLEFVEGGTLAKRLAGAPQPPRDAAQLVHTLALAMDAAHARGIVHRDLKPANVLLAGADDAPVSRCVPKIADFGLAKQLDNDSGQTQTGAIMGTPSYMAPEQAGGPAGAIGPATDVYALGAILYELLTGRPPFRGATLLDTLGQVREREPVPPREMQPSTPRDLETVCLKCLQKEPAKRYPTAKELADDLDRFLKDRPILARPAGAAERAVKFTRRNKILVVGVAAVIAVLLLGILTTSVGALAALYQTGQARAAQKEEEKQKDKAQAALFDLQMKSADLALQKGDLKNALDIYNDALKDGHPEVVKLRVGKARTLYNLAKIKEVEAELDDLLKRKDLGRYEGEVLLLKGDLLLGPRSEEGLKLIRQALGKELPKGDEAFAKALLAERPADAVAHFRRALQADHYHLRARMLLSVTLLVLGRVREAEMLVVESRGLYPEEPNFLVLHALTLAFQGDAKRAVKVIDEGRQLDPDHARALKEMMPIIESIYQWDDITDPKSFARIMAAFRKARPLLARFLPAIADVGNVEDAVFANDRLRPPPLIEQNLRAATAALAAGALGNDTNESIRKLDKLVQSTPEGSAYFFKGVLLVKAERFREAEEAFARAMEQPSMLNVRPMALIFSAVCVRDIILAEGVNRVEAAVRARGVKHVEQRFRWGPVRAGEGAVLIETAVLCGAPDLARAVLGEWEKVEGVKAEDVLKNRMLLEYGARNYPAAIRTADELLAKNPDDKASIKDVRDKAVKALREFNRANGI
jgi:tetratricopeptide (TPR) repeat protein